MIFDLSCALDNTTHSHTLTQADTQTHIYARTHSPQKCISEREKVSKESAERDTYNRERQQRETAERDSRESAVKESAGSERDRERESFLSGGEHSRRRTDALYASVRLCVYIHSQKCIAERVSRKTVSKESTRTTEKEI